MSERSLEDLVRTSVEQRVPIDDAEAASIDRVLAEFDRLADPFSEEGDPVHATGSAIVVGPRGVLLLRHKRLGLWLQPGGHIDPGETPWHGALREAREETGLHVTFRDVVDAVTLRDANDAGVADDGLPPLIHVDVHAGGRGHTHLDLRYLVDGGDADPCPPEGESQEIGWFSWPDAVERASDERLKALLSSLSRQF